MKGKCCDHKWATAMGCVVVLVLVGGQAGAQGSVFQQSTLDAKICQVGSGDDEPATTCQPCHPVMYSEWSTSYHALSWTNEVYQYHGPHSGPECETCHAPRRILIKGLGIEPDARSGDRSEGVTCVSCHEDTTDAYHAPYDVTAPHSTVQDTAYREVIICMTCHGQWWYGDVGADYPSSPAAQQGITCQDCHMPPVQRSLAEGIPGLPTRTVYEHTFLGAHDLGTLQSATNLLIVFERGRAWIGVHNANLGHYLPGESKRAVRVAVTVRDVQGQIVFQDEYEYQKGEIDTRIAPDDTSWYGLPESYSDGNLHVLVTYWSLPASFLSGYQETVIWDQTVSLGPQVKGDLNGDGMINVLDVIRAVNIILELPPEPTEQELWAADCNGDGVVNILDVVGIVNVILGTGTCSP